MATKRRKKTECSKMKATTLKYQVFFIVLMLLIPIINSAQTIVKTSNASISEEQAANEIRRYIFLRTGTAPSVVTADTYVALGFGTFAGALPLGVI